MRAGEPVGSSNAMALNHRDDEEREREDETDPDPGDKEAGIYAGRTVLSRDPLGL